jgi:hypothetical protein
MNSEIKKCLEQLVIRKIDRMEKDKDTMFQYILQGAIDSRKRRSILIGQGLKMIDEAIIYLKKSE